MSRESRLLRSATRPLFGSGLVALALGIIFAGGMGFAEQPTDHPVNPLANVSLSGPVGSILVQSDGKFIIAGGGSMFFATDGSRALGYLNGTLARFKPDGSLDYSFSCRSEPP